MKVTGYKILDRLSELKEESKELLLDFNSSITYYEGEEKPKDPVEIIVAYQALENKIGLLQELQNAYNLYVKSGNISIQSLIKQQGILASKKSSWSTAISTSKLRSEWGRLDTTRAKQIANISTTLAKDLAKSANKAHAEATKALRIANAREVDLSVLTRKFGLSVTEDTFGE